MVWIIHHGHDQRCKYCLTFYSEPHFAFIKSGILLFELKSGVSSRFWIIHFPSRESKNGIKLNSTKRQDSEPSLCKFRRKKHSYRAKGSSGRFRLCTFFRTNRYFISSPLVHDKIQGFMYKLFPFFVCVCLESVYPKPSTA